MADYTLSVRGEFKDDISKKISGVASTLSNFKEKLNAVSNTASGVKEKIGSVTSVFSNFKNKLSGITSHIPVLGDAIGGLKNRFQQASSGALSFGDVLKANVISDAIIGGVNRLKDSLMSLGQTAYDEGAKIQQSIGGVETLFKDDADTIKLYADAAWASAGMSANEYMENVTGFSASLIQSLGGDTAKAAEVANQAMIDMSDNANKMGTDMESIQNAYQGFAKGNYTMLDNLKLGYGGTQDEMERLLAHAEELSGVHYDISNLADVYEAIHVIQEELDIAGTTAKEASTTLSGSFASMGSAWKNVLGKLAIGEPIENELNQLRTSVLTFADNLIPVVGNIVDAIPDVINGVIDIAGEIVPKIGEAIMEHGPELLEAGHNLLENIINGIIEFGPGIVNGALAIVNTLRSTIVENLPSILDTGISIVTSIVNGFTQNLPAIVSAGGEILTSVMNGIMAHGEEIWSTISNVIDTIISVISEHLPTVLEKGGEILGNIADGIIENLPTLIDTVANVLSNFLSYIHEHLPDILSKGIEMLVALAEGIAEHLPEFLKTILQVCRDIVITISEHLPEILKAGIDILGALGKGIIDSIPDIIKDIGQVLQNIWDAIVNFDWLGLGKKIIDGIGEGIKNFASGIADACESVFDGIADFFGIASPSKLMRDEIGKYIPSGIALGIDANTQDLEKSVERMGNMVIQDTDAVIGGSNAGSYTSNGDSVYNYGGINLSVYGAEGQDEETLADIMEARIRARMAQEQAVFA